VGYIAEFFSSELVGNCQWWCWLQSDFCIVIFCFV